MNFKFGAVNDKDESLVSKSGGKFGLNTGFITKLEYTDKAGKEESFAEAVDIEILIGDKEFKTRIYDVTGDLYGKNNAKISPENEEYEALYHAEMNQRTAVIVHAVKSLGVLQEVIEDAFKKEVKTFGEWCKKLLSLLPKNYTTLPVDVFLEYQWNFGTNKNGELNDKTYLQLPKNMKGGYFLNPHIKPVGSWSENREEGLCYVDSENNVHPFVRSVSYMESNKAVQQVAGQATSSNFESLSNNSNSANSAW